MGGDRIEANYLWYGLSGDTRRSYDRVIKSFVQFSREWGWSSPFFPATTERVGAWISREAFNIVRNGGSLYRKTLKRRVYALSSWHKDLGLPLDGVLSPRVQRVIAGANRYHGIAVKDQPLPITLPILRKIIRSIKDNRNIFGGEIDYLALVAAFTLGFACFMRMGKPTYDTLMAVLTCDGRPSC